MKDDKGIELRYHSLMNQLSFSRFYLAQLGCIIENDNYNVEHKSLEYKSRKFTIHKNQFLDDLYHRFKDFKGLTSENSKIFKDSNLVHETMTSLVKGMIELLNKKLILSQDWLVFCWEYCKQFNMAEFFVNALENVIHDCLGSSSI